MRRRKTNEDLRRKPTPITVAVAGRSVGDVQGRVTCVASNAVVWVLRVGDGRPQTLQLSHAHARAVLCGFGPIASEAQWLIFDSIQYNTLRDIR